VTPTTLITRADIDQTPGASRTIGMEMITDYVPGAYMTHDMLHMRGGHQTSWLIDGIAIPNTKIASNVGPQIDPKDIDSLETQRGSYDSDVGDRTYGVFNVLPRNGFERTATANFSSPAATSTPARRSSRSATTPLQPPGMRASPAPLELRPGHAGRLCLSRRHQLRKRFVSLIRNQTPKDQLRLNAQYRQDHFEVPYDPNPRLGAGRLLRASYGLRDAKPSATPSSSPTGCTQSRPRRCFPLRPSTTSTRPTTIRLQPTIPSPPPGTRARTTRRPGRCACDAGPNSFSAGVYSFYQAENDLFGVQINDGSPIAAQHSRQRQRRTGRVLPLRSPAPRPLRHPARRRALLLLPRRLQTSPQSIPASAQPLKFRACTGCCAASTATSSSPRRLKPSPVPF
jgi:hypothetical protein